MSAETEFTPEPIVDESLGHRIAEGLGHIAGRIVEIVGAMSFERSSGPIVVPEVNRGAFRVPFGTEPDKAAEMAKDYGRRRQVILKAAQERRENHSR
jgi:hypothetical protein